MADIGDIGAWDEVQEQAPLDALPAGPYMLTVIESTAEYTDKAQGRRINVTYEVQSGPYAGRKAWDRFDIDRSANTKNGPAMIDLQRFKTLCVAMGFQNPPRDTSELHGIPFQATAKVEQNDPQYAPQNRWSSYKPAASAPAAMNPTTRPMAAAQPVAARPAPAAMAGTGRPAWPARQMPNR